MCFIRYDPLSDQWTVIASLSGPKDAVGLCVLGDKLYCVGGYDGQKHLRDVECYDSSDDTWNKVSDGGGNSHYYLIANVDHSKLFLGLCKSRQ